MHALHTEDYKLLSSSLEDVIVAPHRSELIPHFKKVKSLALEHGALGTGISGSGPSIFSLCEGVDTANEVKERLESFYNTTSIEFDLYVSKINTEGIKILS